MTNFTSINIPGTNAIKSEYRTQSDAGSSAAGDIQQSATSTSITGTSSTISKIETARPELTDRNHKFSYSTMADPKDNSKLLHMCNTCPKNRPKKYMSSEKAMQLHIRSHIFQDNKKG